MEKGRTVMMCVRYIVIIMIGKYTIVKRIGTGTFG